MIKKLVQYFIFIAIGAAILYGGIYYLLGEKITNNVTGMIAISIVAIVMLICFIKWLIKYLGEIRYLKMPISEIDKMTGEEFEDYLRFRFEKSGFKVELTPASNDYGADLICHGKDGSFVVQAKRYEAHVGTAAVQEVVAAREYYEADGCMVVTNSYFTRNAISLSEVNNVRLIDRDSLFNSFS